MSIRYSLKGKALFKDKKPKTKNNHVGVEIEFLCNFSEEQVGTELLNANLQKNVTLKYDGSIHGYDNMRGFELAILSKESEVESIINKVCKVLTRLEAETNRSCGLHVHIDMRNRDAELAFHNLVQAQDILFAMNPNSRRRNTYCRKNSYTELDIYSDRYYGINGASVDKHNTIEIRMHAGTINKTKIVNWINLLLKIVDRKAKVKTTINSLSKFTESFKIEKELESYISERIEKFNNVG